MALAVPQTWADELVVGDQSTTSEYVPFYSNYMDMSYDMFSQMIYSTDLLNAIKGATITTIKLHPTSPVSSRINGAVVQISLKETSQNSFANLGSNLSPSYNTITGMTSYGTCTLAQDATELVFDLSTPFEYSGNENLSIEVRLITRSNSYDQTALSFYGKNQAENVTYYRYGYSAQDVTTFLPKTTFTYEASGGSVSVNPTSLNFNESNTYVGGSYQKTFTVNNTTEEAVNITMTGDNVFTFSPSTVAAGSTETITVTYAPTAVGTNNATLTVGGKTVTLEGTAVAAPAPTIMVNPTSLSINTDPGTAASDKFTVTGTNLTNDINLTVSGSGFSVIPNTITKANAANGVDVTVTYTPNNSEGTFTGAITLTSDGAETVTVPVTAIAAYPVISGTVTPTTLNLTCQEGTTTTGTITVENTGNTAFTPTFSTLTAPFSIEAATEIAVGESKQFTVTYAPTAVGTHTGTLTVTINGTATEVTLNGTAEEAPEGGELTVAESTTTGDANMSSIAPIYGGKYNTTGWVQMLYPASLLTDITGKQITKVTFRHKDAPGFSGGAVEVKIGETENANLSSSVDESTLTAVATVSPIGNAFDGSYYLTFEFSKPYLYNGGNLVIQTKVTTKGSESRSRFYGKTTSQLDLGNITTLATSYSPNTGNGYSTSFLPQATFTYEKARGVELVSPEDGVLNFGEVSVKGYKTKTITVKNNNSFAVTPSYNELAYPYSVTDAPESIAAGETATISVTMTPNQDTENIDYNNVALTLTFGDQSIAITINGTSHVNEPTMTTDEFAEIEYTWKDENGDSHTSNLAEVATDPAQMIALMKEVYINRNVPGNWYRGYTSAGAPDREVIYPPIGKIVYGDNGYTYNDAYGWNIGFSENVTEHILDNTTYNYKYFNPDEYKPIKNGLTLLLVEMNDNNVHDDGTWDEVVANYLSDNNPDNYEELRTMFGTIFKSVRVVTQSRRMGAGEEASTLFKLDADKLNRFFLLAKGRLRQFSLDVNRQPNGFIDASSTGNSYRETEEYGPFYQMFEQLSPVDLGNEADVTDVYQSLVNMQSYAIHHDCQAIPFMNYNNVTGHEFNMYGKSSITDDCQDVRDLMITIPERRMQWWYMSGGSDDSRDRTASESSMNDMFINYNKQNVPKMGLFVIKQFPIEGEQETYQDNPNYYKLDLSWTSNLLEFLPTGYGVYNLYRVVTNADGTKTYVKVVDNLDPNTFSYVDHIEMQQTGQVVTYVVQGQDQEQFLSLQLSNEESFVIPGLDRKEQLRIALNSDYYFSRYDAATQTNNYSNSIIANNTVGTNVKPNYLENGSQFKFWRATLDENGEVVAPAEPFVVAEVSEYSETTGGTLTYKDWKDQTDFSGELYGHGYHANVTTSTISIVNGEVKFDGLKLYDNFRVSVEENTHPAQYVYYVTLETAVDFPLNDEGTETSNQATSNTVSVPVYKTGMTMNPLTAAQVEGDVTHALPAGTTFDLNARYSSKSEILGYYIYRWADTETSASARSIYEDNGDDASPQGQAGNQATYYSVAMNSDFTSKTENFTMDANGNHPDVTASFEDNYVFNQATKGDTYTYAPVVELFAPQQAVELPSGDDREDYNTYGGPQQMSAGGKIEVEVESSATTGENGYEWTMNNSTYVYYTTLLKVKVLDLPQGYEVAKVRAWRKVNVDNFLGEQVPGQNKPDYRYRAVLDANGEYMFSNYNTSASDINSPYDIQQGGYIGGEEDSNHVMAGTFGGKKLNNGEEVNMDFVVRIYFTKTGAKAGEQPYYISEVTATDKLTSQIPTSIFGVVSSKAVKGIKYYNVAGVESDVPFQGVNIEVTTYTDGSRTTRKIMK